MDQEEVFIVPHENDVLCGKVTDANSHPGTQRYRALIRQNEIAYARMCRREKTQLTQSIVDDIHGRNGRFLRKTTNDGQWTVLPDPHKKVQQALRERQPQLRLDEILREEKDLTAEEMTSQAAACPPLPPPSSSTRRSPKFGNPKDRRKVFKRGPPQSSHSKHHEPGISTHEDTSNNRRAMQTDIVVHQGSSGRSLTSNVSIVSNLTGLIGELSSGSLSVSELSSMRDCDQGVEEGEEDISLDTTGDTTRFVLELALSFQEDDDVNAA